MRRLLLAGIMLSGALPAFADTIVVNEEFHITESGGWLNKTVKEMGTPEFVAMLSAGCAAFATDCTQQAVYAASAAKRASDVYGSRSAQYYITGQVTKHAGQEWWGIFRSPQGYEICNAGLDYGGMSITGPSTFNTRIVRDQNDNGLGFYSVIPKHRPTRQWVNAQLVITYVTAGTIAQHDCATTNSYPWLCKGQNCSPLTRFDQLKRE